MELSDAIDRLKQMTRDLSGSTWDLSPNDRKAIEMVLGQVEKRNAPEAAQKSCGDERDGKIVDMVLAAENGSRDALISELEAMAVLARNWGKEIGKQNPRYALLNDMLADLAIILATQLAVRCPEEDTNGNGESSSEAQEA